MSTAEYEADYDIGTLGTDLPGPVIPMPNGNNQTLPSGNDAVELHRVAHVRKQQGVSQRSVARKLDISISEVHQKEDPRNDLRVSELLQWQQVLEVPLIDLLVDSDAPLSDPVRERARLLRVMKTAKSIEESVQDAAVKRMALMLIDQLVELMPELAEVAPWHSVGQRRTQDEVGRIVERSIPDSFFNDSAR